MNPWNILGWLLLGAVGLALLWFAIRVGIVGTILAVQIVRQRKRKARMARAHKGKVECDIEGCANIATRRCPRGLACEDHMYNRKVQGLAVSFCTVLDHFKPEFDRRYKR